MKRILSQEELEKMSPEAIREYCRQLKEGPDESDLKALNELFAYNILPAQFGFRPARLNQEYELELHRLFFEKRKKAFLNNMDRVEQISGQLGIKKPMGNFSRTEAQDPYPYNETDADADIRIAAAIWILDHLCSGGTVSAALDLLPDLTGNMDAHYLPVGFHHPCYSNDLINAVIHLLTARHQGDGSIICEENLMDVPPSSAYQKLMDLLPGEDVETACRHFREKLWDLVSRQMKLHHEIDQKFSKFEEEMWRFHETVNVSRRMFTHDDVDQFNNETESLQKLDIEFLSHLNQYLRMKRSRLWKEVPYREMIDALSGFSVEEPFEICFALICLMEAGADEPWIFNSGNNLCLFAVQMLPWYDPDGRSGIWDEEESDLSFNYNGWLMRNPVPESVDYYHTYHQGKNLSQIIYEMSRGVVSPGKHPFEKEYEQLNSEGLAEGTARSVAAAAEALFLSHYQLVLPLTNDLLPEKETDELVAEITEPEEETATIEQIRDSIAGETVGEEIQDDAEIRLEKLTKDLGKARQEIKALREALASERRIAGEKMAEYESDLKKYRSEHRELADLRELVFNRENDVREKAEEKIRFPYETRKRTVVFGGHDSFLRVIRPMLPGVRFVDTDQYAFSSDLIRNADVVWIQTNCIGHSQYNNIARVARQYSIQMRYFAYSSAEKCAVQLAKEDSRR